MIPFARSALCAFLLTIPVVAGAQRYVGRDDDVFTTTLRVGRGEMITVKNVNGPISLVAASGDQVEIRAEKRVSATSRARARVEDVAFDIDESGSGVTICTVYRDESACDENHNFQNIRVSVAYTIAVPADVRVRAMTGNGELAIERVRGDVDAGTGNGRVRVTESGGSVRAATGNGDVRVDGATGPVRVSTGNGRVFVATAEGPVNVSTGNGDIDARMGRLRDAGDMTFTSGSGTIRLTLPADFEGDIDANTGNGALHSDFEIQLHGRMDPQRIRGTIGRGGRMVKLRSGNGRLELIKG